MFEHIGVGKNEDHFVILYYRATPLTFDLAPNGDECTEALWAPPKQLLHMALPPGARHILTKIYPDLGWGESAPPSSTFEEEIPGAPLRSAEDT